MNPMTNCQDVESILSCSPKGCGFGEYYGGMAVVSHGDRADWTGVSFGFSVDSLVQSGGAKWGIKVKVDESMGCWLETQGKDVGACVGHYVQHGRYNAMGRGCAGGG